GLGDPADAVVQTLDEVLPAHMSSVPRCCDKVLTAVAAADPKETSRRLKKLFGPRIEWLMSGGAPLPLPIAQAYDAAGLLVLQGYGLTETSPVMTTNRKDCNKMGTVGRPLPG